MRVIISIAIFLILTLTLCGQTNDANAFFNGSYDKGFVRNRNIVNVIVETCINGKKSSSYLFNFDKYGLLNKQTIVDSSGKKINDYIFTYNKHGDQIKRKNIAYELNKTYSVTFDRTYKGSQLIKEMSSEFPYITQHIYNSNGQKIKSITTLGTDTALASKRITQYAYDDRGRLISIKEALVYNNSSSPINQGSTQFCYDTSGNIITINRDNAATYQISYNNSGLIKTTKTKMPEDLSGIEIVDKYSYRFR